MISEGVTHDLLSINYKALCLEDEEFLKEMLFEAIFMPREEKEKLSREIVNLPELRCYFENWGRSGDRGFKAVLNPEEIPVGCAWGRFFNEETGTGYGFVSPQVPEISVAVLQPFRNRGIGSKLLALLTDEYRKLGVKELSLSVSIQNPAVALYIRANFRIHRENMNDLIMLRRI